MKTIKFYDTSALLSKEKFDPKNELYVISIITLQELENIKSSATSDEELKYRARRFIRYFEEHPDDFQVHMEYDEKLKSNDEKILSSAYNYSLQHQNDETVKHYWSYQFVTNDLAMKCLAKYKWLRNIPVISEIPKVDSYTGYKDIIMNEEEMSEFYSHPEKNSYGLLVNEYINVYNEQNECVDSLVWTGETHRSVKFVECNSMIFGKIKPRDIYQRLALDSFKNNPMTYVSGPPGSGKTMLALAYLFQELEKGHIDRIVVFCNPVPARNTAKLGLKV